MKAIEVRDEALVWADVAEPEPGVGEIRIANRATAVNRADLVQRTGNYPPPPGASPLLGLECAGVVEAVGEGVERFAVGDAVCALLAGGGYAEKVVCPAGQALPIPEGLDFAASAAARARVGEAVGAVAARPAADRHLDGVGLAADGVRRL